MLRWDGQRVTSKNTARRSQHANCLPACLPACQRASHLETPSTPPTFKATDADAPPTTLPGPHYLPRLPLGSLVSALARRLGSRGQRDRPIGNQPGPAEVLALALALEEDHGVSRAYRKIPPPTY